MVRSVRRCIWPEPGPNGETGANMLLDDGGDATLLVHKGVEYEAAGAVPGADTAGSEEEKVILELLRESLGAEPQRFTQDGRGDQGRHRGDDHGRRSGSMSARRTGRCSSRRSTSTTR